MDPGTLGARAWLNVIYALQVDIPDGLVNRYDVIQETNKRLARPLAELLAEAHAAAVLAGKAKPDRATWGKSPQAVAGQRAMMRAAGGPAPLRQPPEDPPA